MTLSRRTSFWAVAPGFVFAVFLDFMSLSEWFRVGVIADPAVVGGYYFGSEAMLDPDKGGWIYATAELYATTALISGLISSAITAIFIMAVLKRSANITLIAYGLLISGLLINRALM